MFTSKMYLPDNKLKDWIKVYWFFKGLRDGKNSTVRHILPDGCVSIIFVLEGTMNLSIYDKGLLKEGIYIAPPVIKSHNATTSNNIHIIDVQFNPSIFYKLFNIPIDKLENRLYTFEELSVDFDNSILEKIKKEKDDNHNIYKLLNNFFLKLFDKQNFFADEIIYSIKELYRTGDLDKFFNEQKLSIRQLERKVKEYTGLTPKNLSRLGRFYSILEYIKFRQFNIEFSEVAFEHNFSDQSHFIREFKFFSQSTPSKFLKHMNDFPQFKGLCNLTKTFDDILL